MDVDGEADEVIRAAAVRAQALVNRLAGLQLRVLERLDGRGAYAAGGARMCDTFDQLPRARASASCASS